MTFSEQDFRDFEGWAKDAPEGAVRLVDTGRVLDLVGEIKRLQAKEKELQDILAVMKEIDGMDETIWWTNRYGKAVAYLNANDLFYWATGDCEEITADDLPAYRQALEDCKNAAGKDCWYGYELFIARKRGMRPQKPCYKHYPTELHPLFDTCGPEQGDRG